MTRLKHDDTGVALIVTLLILMLMAGLMAGFFAAVNADTRSNALDKDQTRAYAAAHAGLEKLTSDLSTLFTADVSPSVGQINALLLYPPQIPGYEYRAPGGATNSGYNVTWKADVNGNPAPDDPSGSTITAGAYRGLKGIITKYPITVTARSTSGGAEVRLRRELQTVAVPVFQFGLFSQTDLSFFAGPNFNFGGRVHTNGTLFLAEGDNSTLTISDRVTAASEIIRWQLSNGFLTGGGSGYTGNVSMEVVQGGGVCCAGWTMRDLARTEGSLVNGPGTANNEPTWTPLSIGTYKSNIRSSRTGATVLNLPVVSQGATPIDLIRRPPTSNEDVINTPVFQQRFFSQASLRILLSDKAADISSATLPTVTGTAPIPLDNWLAGVPAGYGPVDATHPPIARSPGPRLAAVVGPGAPTGNWGNAPPTGVLPVTAAIPAWLKMGVLTATTQAPVLGCTGKTSTTLTGCNVTVAMPAGTVVSAAVTDGTFVRTYTATTTAAAAIGNPRTITFAAGATDLFWRGTFWVDGTAASATTPAPSTLVTCTGYDTTPSFTGCSFSGTAAPIAGQTITTNALASQDQPLNGGFIKIEKQNAAGVWSDVTLEILNLGYAATNSDGFICPDPNPNAVLRLQRLKDNGRPTVGPVTGTGGYCDYASSLNPYDYWPNTLYDAREGDYRDGVAINGAGSAMNVGGVMNYIALDMPNLKRWLAGNIGVTGNQAWNNNGYIVYFSDRRGNHWLGAPVANAETAEYGAEDNVNPASATGLPASGGFPIWEKTSTATTFSISTDKHRRPAAWAALSCPLAPPPHWTELPVRGHSSPGRPTTPPWPASTSRSCFGAR